ncbi:MBL fold metallo-hydrolase [Sulfurisphaera ohwakuensis]|uniref:MBL fold metallo-hydrolase n=2 Tax=Sulfurisphaera ohwakuensis TaxID=69656 RepID=A0A650CJ21_SULOH|nr:MBL fold metallo-hydrolase [Sulfurisphaera ohwakuensis]
MMEYSIKILGGGKEVGRAAIEVSTSSESIILDYGVNFDANDNPNLPLQEVPSKVKGFIVSHSHLDHVGALPLYQISGNFPIFGTRLTRLITELMLKDFLKLSGAKVPFEWTEVRKVMDNFRSVKYHEEFEVGTFKTELGDAGHIPGSSMIKIKTEKGNIVYTGDTNVINTHLVKPAELEFLRDANVLIIESTYGRFNHPERKVVEEEFFESVKEVVEGGGTVLVPAFSLSRSQEILSVLSSRNFDYPVYYDGMVKEITELMIQNPEFINDYESLKKAYNYFKYVNGWNDRNKATRNEGVIVSSAGMLKGGPAVYYFKKIADNPKNAVFLVSYQAENTPGRRLLETGKFDEYSPMLKARFQIFDFSSHAGKNQLKDMIKSAKNLEKVILVHGSPDSSSVLAEELKRELGVEVIVAENGQEIKVF